MMLDTPITPPACPSLSDPSRSTSSASRTLTLVELMQVYAAGDDAVFSLIYRALAPKVRRQVVSIVGKDPHLDDLVQDTFLKAHTARARFCFDRSRSSDGVISWYCAIARNTAVSELRRRYMGEGLSPSWALPVSDELPSEQPDAERSVLVAEQRDRALRAIRASIAALPEAQRRVVEMHKLHELPMREVARRLGIRPGAARVRAHRAYRVMADQIRKEEDED